MLPLANSRAAPSQRPGGQSEPWEGDVKKKKKKRGYVKEMCRRGDVEVQLRARCPVILVPGESSCHTRAR
jgi:hypothetical protein